MRDLKKQSRFSSLSEITKYCVLSGLLAFAIMLFVYFVHSNTLLGGDRTVLRMDLYHQYGPLYAELYDRITGGYSLVYSWTSGLGSGFLGNFFNYCCSPFALIMLLLGHKNMPEAIAIMILLKAVLSSVTFTYYINKSTGSPKKYSAAFGLLYTFCGYFVAYSWNIMWLDAITVFPLVILGIERIINQKKPFLFLGAMVYTMITNYYMAYMVVLFSCIYFLYYYIGNNDLSAKFDPSVMSKKEMTRFLRHRQQVSIRQAAEAAEQADSFTFNHDAITPPDQIVGKANAGFFKRLFNHKLVGAGALFAAMGLLAFFISAFSLLPVFCCLQTSSATGADFPQKIATYFNIFDFAANHLPGLTTTIRSSGDDVLPNIYCGLVTVLLLPFYYLSSRIPGKKKIVSAFLLVFLLLGFMINIPNFIWHGFHFPNDLPYRYSFAYSFILLTLAYSVISHIGEFTRKHFIVAGMAMVAFAVLLSKVGSPNVNTLTLTLTIAFAILYVIVAGLLNAKNYTKKSVQNLFIFFIVIELIIANSSNYVMQQPKDAYIKDYDDYQAISQTVEANEDNAFYRTELSKLLTRMDACWYGYNGVSTFSSMAYEHVAKLMEKLGMFGNDINSYTYYPQTPIFNSLFSLKYIYDNNNLLSSGDLYKEVGQNDTYTAYEYQYFLPLAFAADHSIIDWGNLSSDPFEVQNQLMKKVSGVGNVLIPVDATNLTGSNVSGITVESVNAATTFSVNKESSDRKSTVNIFIDVEDEGEYYVFAGGSKSSNIRFSAEDFSYDYNGGALQNFILDMGYHKKGDQIKVEYEIEENNTSATMTFSAARLDMKAFEKAYKKINDNGVFRISEFEESSLSGTIDVKNDNAVFFTSIPYDRSWHVYVDGKEMTFWQEGDQSKEGLVFGVCDALLGFTISKGQHTVEFRYVPNGLSEGLCMSLIGCGILAVMIIVAVLKKRKKNQMDVQEAMPGVETSFAEPMYPSPYIPSAPPQQQADPPANDPLSQEKKSSFAFNADALNNDGSPDIIPPASAPVRSENDSPSQTLKDDERIIDFDSTVETPEGTSETDA